jgi:cytochrome c55X
MRRSAFYGIAVATAIALAGATHAEEAKPAGEPQRIADGKALYYRHCVHCHGVGMISPGTAAADLRKFPRDQKERFATSVAKGRNNRMPPWGDILSSSEIESLWAFVRTGGKG